MIKEKLFMRSALKKELLQFDSRVPPSYFPITIFRMPQVLLSFPFSRGGDFDR